jgi:hypothetical protein
MGLKLSQRREARRIANLTLCWFNNPRRAERLFSGANEGNGRRLNAIIDTWPTGVGD